MKSATIENPSDATEHWRYDLTGTELINNYHGCGGYLLAIDENNAVFAVEKCETIRGRSEYAHVRHYCGRITKASAALRGEKYRTARESFERQVLEFQKKNTGRIEYGFGSCTEISVAPRASRCALMTAGSDFSDSWWRMNDFLREFECFE